MKIRVPPSSMQLAIGCAPGTTLSHILLMKVIWYTESYEAHAAAASPNTSSASLGCNSKLIYQILSSSSSLLYYNSWMDAPLIYSSMEMVALTNLVCYICANRRADSASRQSKVCSPHATTLLMQFTIDLTPVKGYLHSFLHEKSATINTTLHLQHTASPHSHLCNVPKAQSNLSF